MSGFTLLQQMHFNHRKGRIKISRTSPIPHGLVLETAGGRVTSEIAGHRDFHLFSASRFCEMILGRLNSKGLEDEKSSRAPWLKKR